MSPTEFTERISQVEAERDALASALAKAVSDREHYREIYLDALERIKRLEQGVLGQKSERLPSDESQLTLQILGTLLAGVEPGSEPETTTQPEPAASEPPKKEHPTRKKPKGRNRLPEDLPRVVIELIPDEVQRLGLEAFDKLPGEVSETLERRPSSMVVVTVIRPRFVLKNSPGAEESEAEADVEAKPEVEFFTHEPIELPIERGLAGPSLLADSVVKRFQDHLPLHRIAQIYGREGVHLARSTLCGWHQQLAESLRPLIAAMWKDVLTSVYICTDATGVLVQDKDKCRRGHFWVVVAPERHVLYGYSARHDSEAVDRLLAGYEGYLVADAHTVYDHLYLDETILEVGCWAHTRRYFFKALSSEHVLAREALALIGELFRLDGEMQKQKQKQKQKLPPQKRKEYRDRHMKPLVDRFFAWCDQHAPHVIEDTPIFRGIRYATNQREALRRFLDDGRLPIHNNISELHLRRQAIGRKNWLFVGNDEGGEVNAILVTLLASCQMHGLEPWAYLRDLLCLLPNWPARRVLELAPVHWRETLQKPEAQQLLAENVCRRVVLGELDGHRVEV
ncbi:MAG: IS66 family transposase [Deltaproteobacteria bacterium]|nr:IS66 family transposase [Deltaproteobacteria bacterium]